MVEAAADRELDSPAPAVEADRELDSPVPAVEAAVADRESLSPQSVPRLAVEEAAAS
jgi:hypothetical protein